MSAPPEAPRAPSYLLVGPPDLLHDLALDFIAVGWEVTVVGWRAVVSASAEDAAAPQPGWPTEITLSGVGRDGHGAACAEHLGGGG
jgi:hypothetical protein